MTILSTSPSHTRDFGDYIISNDQIDSVGKTLGEGTFGKVKLAYHKLTGQPVAIKVLQKHLIREVADVQRVNREMHILKLLKHKYIVQLYEIIETPKQLFLVMEYVDGGELFNHIVKSKRLADQEAAKILAQLLDAVEYQHVCGVAHRDLKPQNILLDEGGNVRVVDFGLSNLYRVGQTLKTPCGSPCYAAPQMIKGERYEGIHVDIWACGVILFAMLCGYLPFENQDIPTLYQQILAGQFTPHHTVSQSAIDLLKGMLCCDHTNRFTIDQVRGHPWLKKWGPGIIVKGYCMGDGVMRVEMKVVDRLSNLYRGQQTDNRVKLNQIVNTDNGVIGAISYLGDTNGDGGNQNSVRGAHPSCISNPSTTPLGNGTSSNHPRHTLPRKRSTTNQKLSPTVPYSGIVTVPSCQSVPSPSYIVQCLEANRHNNVTTAYYLELRKYVREGGVLGDDGSSGEKEERRKKKTKGKKSAGEDEWSGLIGLIVGINGGCVSSTTNNVGNSSHNNNNSMQLPSNNNNSNNNNSNNNNSHNITKTHNRPSVNQKNSSHQSLHNNKSRSRSKQNRVHNISYLKNHNSSLMLKGGCIANQTNSNNTANLNGNHHKSKVNTTLNSNNVSKKRGKSQQKRVKDKNNMSSQLPKQNNHGDLSTYNENICINGNANSGNISYTNNNNTNNSNPLKPKSFPTPNITPQNMNTSIVQSSIPSTILSIQTLRRPRVYSMLNGGCNANGNQIGTDRGGQKKSNHHAQQKNRRM